MTAPLEPLIEISDVQEQLGETLDGTEGAQVNWFIAYASAILRARRSDVDSRMFDGTLSPVLVKGVVVTAVVRALDSMRVGLRVRTTQYPEVQSSYADADPRLVYFTDDELAILDPDAGTQAGGAFSIVVG